MQKKIFLIIVGLSIVGCQKSNNNSTTRDNANDMYDKLHSHIISYTDSLKILSDSLSIEQAINNYETKLTDIIFSYPPNTDIVMTTGQQDTLWQLTDKFIKLKKAKQTRLNKSDTDTLKINQKT